MWRLFFSLYVVLTLFVCAFSVLTNQYILNVDTETLEKERTQDLNGWLLTLDALEKNYTETQWKRLAKNINQTASLPTHYLSRLELEKKYSSQFPLLLTKRLSFIDLENLEFIYLLEGGQGGFHIGPFIDQEGGINDIETNFDYLFFFLLAIIVFFWNARLQYKLRKLERVTLDLGAGILTVRASEKPQHRIGHLNHQFNQMAVKLCALINGNRDLTNAVSHELRSPISRLKCGLELASKSSKKEDQKKYILDMSDDVLELESLVSEILNYARLENSSSTNKVNKRLVVVLQNRLKVWKREFKQDISFICEADICAHFDENQLCRVLNNLIHNAVNSGATKIAIQVEDSVQQNKVLIHIDDNGPGIPKPKRKRVFEPFFQIDYSRTKCGKGYGLGLAIVQKIAMNHGGKATIDDSPLGGARFTLPLDIPEFN